jgi:hypothetical protein
MRAVRSLLKSYRLFEKSHPGSIPFANESISPLQEHVGPSSGITLCSPASISWIRSSSASAGGGRDIGAQIAEE